MRWLVLVALSCGGKSEEPAPAPGSDVPARPIVTKTLDTLSVTVKGKPVAMTRAFVERRSPDNWRVLISDQEGSCDELLSSTTDVKPGATTLKLDFSKQLALDGSQPIRAYELGSALGTTESHAFVDVGPIELSGSAASGKTMTLVLPEITDRDASLTIKGTVTATGCGDEVPRKAIVRPTSATITVGGKQLEVKAVALFPDGDLAISTEPLDCNVLTPPAQIVLWHTNRQWQLSGSWMSGLRQAVANDADAKKLVIAIGASKTTSDGKVATVTLRGGAQLRDFHDDSGYAIEVAGTAQAADCRDGK